MTNRERAFLYAALAVILALLVFVAWVNGVKLDR